MDDVIQCPSCSKKYRLPAKPPPTFTCKACNTVMDLSGFGQAAAPEPEPVAAAVEAPARESRSTGRRSGGRAAASRGAAGGRRGRGRRQEEDEEEAGGRRGRPEKKDNTKLIVGASIGGLLLVVVVIVLMVNKGKGDDGKDVAAKPPEAGAPGAAPGTPGAPGTPAATTPAPATPEVLKPEEKPAPGTSGGSYSPSKAEIKTYPYLDDVSADDKSKIEQAVTALWSGGADGRDAEKYLVSMGLKAAPRLISEFKAVQDKHGFEKPEGLSVAMVIDRTLRRIDGVQERKFKDMKHINANSELKLTLSTIRNWNWWWDTGAYKTPHKPWDPAVDEADPSEEK